MSLNWEWSGKVGEMTVVEMHPDEPEREFKFDLYNGNACLIMIYEFEENGQEMYNVSGFFVDKAHMKNCLGLNKKGGYTSNIYETPYRKVTRLRLNKSKCRDFKDIVAAFAQAFSNITIEIYSD
jgi:hypothetical protein